MRHGTYTFEQFLMYGLAVALAIAVAFSPGPARSGASTNEPVKRVGPRWSNDRQLEYGLIVRPDCVALPPGAGAEYVPGRDAYGRPIIPAEPPNGFSDSFPAEVDLNVNLGSKQVAGSEIEMYAGRFTYDPASNDISLNGRSWRRDCLPSPK